MNRFFAFVALVVLASHAGAAIVGTSGDIATIAGPPDLRLGHLESSDHLFLFAERQAVTLTQNLAVDLSVPGTSPSATDANLSLSTIPSGTLVDSYYVHYDIVGSPVTGISRTGSVTFDTPVLGIIIGLIGDQKVNGPGNTLDLSDGPLGLPGTIYGLNPIDLNPSAPDGDSITLSADRRTVTMHLFTAQDDDNLRIVTAAVPEPSSAAVILVGGVGLLRRRRARLNRTPGSRDQR